MPSWTGRESKLVPIVYGTFFTPFSDDAILTALMTRRVTIRNLLLIAILAVVFGLGARLWTHRSEPAPDPLVDSLPADADLALQDIQYTETSDGLRRWTLTAKSGAYDAGQGKSAVQDMRMELFDKQGHGQMVLTADQGIWFSETGEIEAQGNVVITTTEGYTLHTERLRYFSKTDEVTTDQPVHVKKGNSELFARGMRYGLKDRFLTLTSQVRAIFADGIGNQ
jgi:LPS export ABC transporter protein LptC